MLILSPILVSMAAVYFFQRKFDNSKDLPWVLVPLWASFFLMMLIDGLVYGW